MQHSDIYERANEHCMRALAETLGSIKLVQLIAESVAFSNYRAILAARHIYQREPLLTLTVSRDARMRQSAIRSNAHGSYCLTSNN